MKVNPWLTRESVAQMASIKNDHPDGLDVFTAMAIAAHKQWEDVDVLLGLAEAALEGGLSTGVSRDQILKIHTRHDTYAEAKKGRTDSVFP